MIWNIILLGILEAAFFYWGYFRGLKYCKSTHEDIIGEGYAKGYRDAIKDAERGGYLK